MGSKWYMTAEDIAADLENDEKEAGRLLRNLGERIKRKGGCYIAGMIPVSYYCCCSPGLSQTYSYMLSQTLFEKWVWKNQKYIFNRLTVLLCVFRLVVKAANGVYLALTTSLNTHTLWQRLTN